MMTLVCTEEIDDQAPTPKMLRICDQRSGASRSRAALRPDKTYQPSTAVPATLKSTSATPPPAMPSAGNGPMPKIRHGDSGTSTTTPTQITKAGTSMLPVPRIALARAFRIQMKILPAKTTLE